MKIAPRTFIVGWFLRLSIVGWALRIFIVGWALAHRFFCIKGIIDGINADLQDLKKHTQA